MNQTQPGFTLTIHELRRMEEHVNCTREMQSAKSLDCKKLEKTSSGFLLESKFTSQKVKMRKTEVITLI